MTKPELPTPFPNTPDLWTDPKTGIVVPKEAERNLAWRLDLLSKAEKDEGMQRDLLAACAESQLFFINAFCMTYHQFDVGPDGKRLESKYPDQPMITWSIQDELLSMFETSIPKGEDVLIDKARDMGASWCCIDYVHWLMLFRPKTTELLEMSRNEDYVDKPGNMKALFQKHDYINQWLPSWMQPPDCFLGQVNRQHLHWYNPITGITLDGESTTKHAARGDRRFVGLLDEFGAAQNGAAMRMASRDSCLARIINSTSVPGSEYNKWRSDGTIKVFVMPFWEHPDKGANRYVKQTKNGKWEIRSPWFDSEERIRGAKHMATEVLREDTEPGLSFFVQNNIDNHEAMYARPPKSVWDIKWRKNLGYEDLAHYIADKDLSMILAREQALGPLKIWCELKDGRLDQTKSYIFGIDTGKGQGASNSVISIKCKETGEKVGEWADATYPPYDFAQIVLAVALWIGGAKPLRLPFLKWEKNGPGWDLGRIIVKKCLYPYFYRGETTDKITTTKNKTYGFQTGRDSKYMLLSAYDKALTDGTYINRSKIALEEARTYIHFENGGVGPAMLMQESATAKRTHGDRVMADALTIEDKEMPKVKTDKSGPSVYSAGYRFLQYIKNKRRQGKLGFPKKRIFDFSGVC
jgi:hypothetical protein